MTTTSESASAAADMSVYPPLPKMPSTLWRLVDAKCSQLKDTIGSTRLALFALMLWTFALFVAMYNHEFGYVNKLLARYESRIARAEEQSSYCEFLMDVGEDGWISRYHTLLKQRQAELHTSSSLDKKPLEVLCKDILTVQHDELLKEQIRTWQIGIPTLGGHIFVFDAGIAGQLGLVVLLWWFFLATRRENHAVRSFVDIPEGTVSRLRWTPHRYLLVPRDGSLLSSEHYCFAYHAVAQRFMFLFSSSLGPLLSITTLFILIPAIVCLWISYSDVRDLLMLRLEVDSAGRAIASATFFLVASTLSVLAAMHTVRTSVLLNGWFLASRDVWIKDWDERNNDPTPNVIVDRENQTASKEPSST